jgi:hypothetical protein
MKQFDYNNYLKNNPLLKEVNKPTRQTTGDEDADWMGEDFNLIRKMKDFAGEKGWTFSARRPTDEEDQIAREYMESQGKKLGSIGVDRITGNINVMEPNGDFRAILSPDGEELSAWEMDIHENNIEEIKTGSLAGDFGYGSVDGPKDPQLMAIAKVLIKLNNEISSVKTDKITAALKNIKTPKTPEGRKLKQDIDAILKMHYQLYLALNSAISSTVDIDNNA